MKYVEEVVGEILTKIENKKLSLRLVMEEYFKTNPDLYPIKGLVRAYSLGLLRKYRIIDEYINTVLEADKLKGLKRNILRAVVYEIVFREVGYERIHKILKRHSLDGLITRKTFKDLRNTSPRELVKRYGKLRRLAILLSQPDWIVDYTIKLLGEDGIKLLISFNQPHPLWVRVNTKQITSTRLLKKLRKRGLKVEKDEDLPDVIKIKEVREALSHLPEYQQGLFYIQDKASILVGHVVSPKEGEKILDACAAPGSKSTHLSILAPHAKIVSVDISYGRLKFLKEYMKKHRLRNIDIIVADSRRLPLHTSFNKILLDPDCSSLGRLGHSPEIRLWIKKSYVKYFSKLQAQLLEQLYNFMKRGTKLVYSTCTYTLEENELLLKTFLENHGDVELVEHDPFIGKRGFLGLSHVQRLYTHEKNTLTFTISVLEKG